MFNINNLGEFCKLQMKLQTIKSLGGKPEYVLLLIMVYQALREAIELQLEKAQSESEYELFDAADYIQNPVALTRIKAKLTQQQLADLMGVAQAYISRLESQLQVSPKSLLKVKAAIANKAD